MKTNIKSIVILFIVFTLIIMVTMLSAQGEFTKRRLILILDASYSMSDNLHGKKKIDLAKDTVLSLLETYSGTELGIIVYGHRYSTSNINSCEDIELIKDFDTNEVNLDKIMNIKGQGKTPIAKSIEFATQYFHPEKMNHIILLSDGIDTCTADPCLIVERLKAEYPNFRVDTVGFTLRQEEIDILDCISVNSGGQFYKADSVYELRDGINTFFYDTNPDTGKPKANEEPDIETEEDMVFIKGGTYTMGNDKAVKPDEKPAHDVFIQSMMMKMTEVTNAEYAVFLNEAGYDSKWIDLEKAKIILDGDTYRAESGAEDLPVVFVTWYGANAYARHYGGRLPYEAEWEYAAYGNNYDNVYPWGEEEFVEGEKMANYDYSRNDLSDLTDALMEVGSFEPNEYELYDIAGNVWEWCHDWYDEDYYEESESIMPVGPIEGRYKVRRGGSWFNNELSLRVTNRGFARPSAALRDTGFRYVISVSPESLEEE